MLSDSRFSEEDMLATINHLKLEGGKKFNLNTLEASKHFYSGDARGSWDPSSLFAGKDILLIGAGASATQHRTALESYITSQKPIVVALNTQSPIDQSLIDVRIACHPVRLFADCNAYKGLSQPIITPASMLPTEVINSIASSELLDYGLSIKPGIFEFGEFSSTLPASLVFCYALAVMTAGKANRITMAGFDGFNPGDSRNSEMERFIELYKSKPSALELLSITPTRYDIKTLSIYGLVT
jgi:4-hydroxy 2-oxovalerate aldolase